MRFTLENDPICSRQRGLWFEIEVSWILRALFSRFKKDKDALHTHDVKWNARLSLTTDRSAEESTLCGVSGLKMNYLYNLSSRGVKAMTAVARKTSTVQATDTPRNRSFHPSIDVFIGQVAEASQRASFHEKKARKKKKINIRHRLGSTAAFGAIPPPKKSCRWPAFCKI